MIKTASNCITSQLTPPTKMGRTEYDDARASTSDVEETLPLYEESEVHQLPVLEAPPPTATPDDVRDFLVRVMQARGIGLDHARRVAARWTVGTGRELRLYPPYMYRDIFGSEDGWMLYKIVRVMYYEKEMKKALGTRTYIFFALASLGIFCGSMAIFTNSVTQAGWVVAATFGLMIGLLGVPGSLFMIFWRPTAEQKAENELRNEGYKASSAG